MSSFHQLVIFEPKGFFTPAAVPLAFQVSWWSYRKGHTRSHPEHGS
jgi:hypothetical protein